MGEAYDGQAVGKQPVPDGFESWNAYWTAQGMSWRTEPELGEQRQQFLAERRAVHPDIEKGIYPFCDENGSIKLDRADVEWLLAMHESGGKRGPVWWNEEKERAKEQRRSGLDLRGADLREADLTHMPLASLRGGLDADEWRTVSAAQWQAAAIQLEAADLRWAHLEGAVLYAANMTRCALFLARMEHAYLRSAYLSMSDLYASHLEDAWLREAHMEGCNLYQAHLERANLYLAHLEGVVVKPTSVVTQSALVTRTDLRSAYFDVGTYLREVTLGTSPQNMALVANLRWGGADLTVLNWSRITMLGDEDVARQPRAEPEGRKDEVQRLRETISAVQANRQLSVVLRAQGLNETADYFAYRAQLLQRQVLCRQGKLGRAFGSWLLDVIAGYGYKPTRSAIAYLLIICLFAAAYLVNAQFAAPHLSWDEALVLSVSSFHGRGFFTSGISLGDTLARLAAGEAIIGLLIEITFIATFTQRFFAR